jgi:hypothetical protein
MDNPSPTFVAPNRPRTLRAFGVFWMIETILGLGFATYGAISGEEAWFVATLVGLGLFLAFVGIVLGALSFHRARIKGPFLTVGPEGLHDAGITDKVIPWPAVSWRHVVYFRGEDIMYDIDETITGPLRLSWPVRTLAAFNRAFGFGRFTLPGLGTGKSLGELATILSAYKPESRS